VPPLNSGMFARFRGLSVFFAALLPESELAISMARTGGIHANARIRRAENMAPASGFMSFL
jgi:hypothetical protein